MQIILIYAFEIFFIAWHKVVFDWRMEQKKSSDLVVNPFLDHSVLGLAKHKLFLYQIGINLGRREEDF